MVLAAEQKSGLDPKRRALQSHHNAVFVAFPGDETPYGGCLAAGRGFIHIGPDGSLEPCPFAPFSDASVAETSLRDALGSEFLARLRAAHERLTESEGGCELWASRDWVASLLRRTGPGRPARATSADRPPASASRRPRASSGRTGSC